MVTGQLQWWILVIQFMGFQLQLWELCMVWLTVIGIPSIPSVLTECNWYDFPIVVAILVVVVVVVYFVFVPVFTVFQHNYKWYDTWVTQHRITMMVTKHFLPSWTAFTSVALFSIGYANIEHGSNNSRMVKIQKKLRRVFFTMVVIVYSSIHPLY